MAILLLLSFCIFLRDVWKGPRDDDEERIVALKLFVWPGRGIGCIIYVWCFCVLFSSRVGGG